MRIVAKVEGLILSEDTSVYVCRPGRYFRYVDDFLDANVVFLDFPGLNLDDLDWDSEDAFGRIAASRLRRINEIDRDVNYRPKEPAVEEAVVRRETTIARGLYDTAKKDDIVLVPSSGFLSDVSVARIKSNRIVYREIEAKGDVYRFPCRSIEFVESVPTKDFDVPIIRRLKTQTGFFDVTEHLSLGNEAGRFKEAFTNRVLERALGTYVSDDKFSLRLKATKEKFSSDDEFEIQSFFRRLIMLQEATRRHETEEFRRRLEANEVFWERAYRDVNFNDSLVLDIASPGFLRWTSTKTLVATAIVLLGMFANLDVSAMSPEQLENLEVVLQVGDDEDGLLDCLPDVERHVQLYIKNIASDWHNACEQHNKLVTETGIVPEVEVTAEE